MHKTRKKSSASARGKNAQRRLHGRPIAITPAEYSGLQKAYDHPA